MRSTAKFGDRPAAGRALLILRYFDAMIEAAHAMSAEQEAEFRVWRNLPTSCCDHDWPGWIPLIGYFPGRARPTVLSAGKRESA